MTTARSSEDDGRLLVVRIRGGGTCKVLVSAEDFERAGQHEWVKKADGTIVRRFARAGRWREQTLAQFLLGGTLRRVCRRGEEHDYRRGSLVESRGVSIRHDRRQPGRPFVVRVKIGDASYSGGSWPQLWMAEAAADEIEAVLPRLVGHAYERAYVQQQISQAAGWPSSGRTSRVVVVDAAYRTREVGRV
jgi:hypothetical protein